MTQPDTPTPSPVERGQKLLKIFDAAADRLLKELTTDGTFKPSLIAATIDLLRLSEFDARRMVTHELPAKLGSVITNKLPDGVTVSRRFPVFDNDDRDDSGLEPQKDKSLLNQILEESPSPMMAPFKP